jgi:hypothetical protein
MSCHYNRTELDRASDLISPEAKNHTMDTCFFKDDFIIIIDNPLAISLHLTSHGTVLVNVDLVASHCHGFKLNILGGFGGIDLTSCDNEDDRRKSGRELCL